MWINYETVRRLAHRAPFVGSFRIGRGGDPARGVLLRQEADTPELYDYLVELLDNFEHFDEHNFEHFDDDNSSGDYNVGSFFDHYDSSGRTSSGEPRRKYPGGG